jgi:hypothetical protein
MYLFVSFFVSPFSPLTLFLLFFSVEIFLVDPSENITSQLLTWLHSSTEPASVDLLTDEENGQEDEIEQEERYWHVLSR